MFPLHFQTQAVPVKTRIQTVSLNWKEIDGGWGKSTRECLDISFVLGNDLLTSRLIWGLSEEQYSGRKKHINKHTNKQTNKHKPKQNKNC